jgi:hypothetical protein
MKVICKENFGLPLIIGEEYDVIINIENFPFCYKLQNVSEPSLTLPFTRYDLFQIFSFYIKVPFKFGR